MIDNVGGKLSTMDMHPAFLLQFSLQVLLPLSQSCSNHDL